MINRIKYWFKKELGVLSIEECKRLNLDFYCNVYGDPINMFNCRSFWRDKNFKNYSCRELYYE